MSFFPKNNLIVFENIIYCRKKMFCFVAVDLNMKVPIFLLPKFIFMRRLFWYLFVLIIRKASNFITINKLVGISDFCNFFI